ncbi:MULTISPECIES: Cu(I)-responsive transcriptional regulator [Nisaea]|jgi:MerR family transcriptional regulator, copper efflux regulator|uniref:Cu(I)-responsive transcriptional regulator n=1 Tax=Nisaea TaxID=390876 RepID=UPI0004120ABC|nr:MULTISPECIES: Cu(I)-responsive transcriptional regulator [Nisaea]|tara:strand:- start:379 stop:804 length:426 start_codon:yes stop_codon:yes gene_type:complete
MSILKNIGQASRASNLPVKTIRYYEDIGLVVAPRSENGYRQYGDIEIHKLRFVQRARSLGFCVDDCRTLLSLYEDSGRSSADVKRLAQKNLDEIEVKIVELRNLREVLVHLLDHCAGDDRPECPIINDLSGDGSSGNLIRH